MMEVTMAQRATERVEVRMRPEVLARIREAADRSHLTVSAFVTAAALERADDVIAQDKVWTVPAAQFDAMVASLDSPPVANPELVAALRVASQVVEHK